MAQSTDQISLDQARALYPEIKNLLPLVSPEWNESYNLSEGIAEICIPNRIDGDVEPIANILPGCPYDDRMLMIKARLYVGALWVLLHEAFRHIPKAASESAEAKQEKNPFAKACAILSGKQPFRHFLTDRYGLEAVDNERVDTKVRFILSIKSRTELDTDPDARERWFSLVRQYEAWGKAKR